MKQHINCKGKLIDIKSPKIMGILNLTPDSFFDGGKYKSIDNALKQTEKMLNEGADFIDIGAMSSRPNAEIISIDEEKQRLYYVVEKIIEKFPETILSIDTFRANIAKDCVAMGASIINDISGGDADANMFATIAELKCPYILMHMRGNAQTMQSKTQYTNVTQDVIQEISTKINALVALNVSDIIIDLGFGFSKTTAQNYQLLNELDIVQKIVDFPQLVGISRKSMIWKPLKIQAKNALNGTTALHMLALQKGVKILRVHDVKEAKEVVQLFDLLNG